MRNDNVESVINKLCGCRAQLVHWLAYETNAYCMPEQSPVRLGLGRDPRCHGVATSPSAAELFETADATWRRQTVRVLLDSPMNDVAYSIHLQYIHYFYSLFWLAVSPCDRFGLPAVILSNFFIRI